jgi:hypothetical protein
MLGSFRETETGACAKLCRFLRGEANMRSAQPCAHGMSAGGPVGGMIPVRGSLGEADGRAGQQKGK